MGGKPRQFKVFKEKSLPWGHDIDTMFKDYEAF
jgi:hypothetical protein